jgi:mannose-6-phosphate isomerase-like protein (cupin superfamily)
VSDPATGCSFATACDRLPIVPLPFLQIHRRVEEHSLEARPYCKAGGPYACRVSIRPGVVSQHDDSSRQIANPAVGVRGTILRTGSETNGQLFEVEFHVESDDWTGPDHIHLRQEERFEIMSGTLRLRADGSEELLTPGSTRALPPRTVHNFRNDGPDEARFLLQLRPALRMEAYLRDLWRAANEGSKRRWGAPSMLELAVIQREYPDEFFYLSRPPVRVQKIVLGALAVLGRAKGYRAGRQGPLEA